MKSILTISTHLVCIPLWLSYVVISGLCGTLRRLPHSWESRRDWVGANDDMLDVRDLYAGPSYALMDCGANKVKRSRNAALTGLLYLYRPKNIGTTKAELLSNMGRVLELIATRSHKGRVKVYGLNGSPKLALEILARLSTSCVAALSSGLSSHHVIPD